MKVFISWSGNLSKQVALLLKVWIKDVLQATEPWISDEDIEKGSLWFGDISSNLADTRIGILCLTRENISAPWVLFEAGALSKGLSTSRVCPILVNLAHADVKPPLSQFNGTLPTKDDMLKLILTINEKNEDKPLSNEKAQKSFEKWWDDFESKFSAVLKGQPPSKEIRRRPVQDMVEEILEITRSIQKSSQNEALMRLRHQSEQADKSRIERIQNLKYATTTDVMNRIKMTTPEFLAQALEESQANKKQTKNEPDNPNGS